MLKMRATSLRRVSTTLQLMRCPADDVILDLLRQFDKEGAVSGNAHHQPGIILWALLRFPQRVGVHHVKLNMLQLKLGKRP